ncbi:M48 family metalloprotease [Nitrogeniibacter mangrovi]|uniref:M48 family metalloprotease n=1 Tax=Nitrogeniibacter mangrovi TaxID=2016596 RepID=A0A6C1B8M3_9RHOO|nr:M48 family metallopeptidase [Nitrogeniibacter mangrovi]QID19185.1 M48 family metalloprotease [Nitrogeniibacter mangrovi]
MHSFRPRSSDAVRSLARQLTLRAALGLGLLAAAGIVSLALSAGALVEIMRAPVLSAHTLGMLAGTGCLLLVAHRLLHWLRTEAPPADGVRIGRDKAPSLYRLVDRLAERIGTAGVDGIRISADMNAAVHQRPIHGLWGRMETTLVIGLPLVHSVSPRQLAAILAHEFGHLKRQRSNRHAWGAHVRAWWHRVCERIASDANVGAQVLSSLLAPWAEADVMAAVRLNHLEEYEADRVAARVVGAKLLGDTLVEVAMKAEFIESDYWDKIMSQAEYSPRPTMRPFRDMGMGVAAGFHGQPHQGLLRSLVSEERDGLLHPTLTDRLVALRVAPRVPRRAVRSAANHYLRPALPRLSRRFDSMWWRATRPAWRSYYRQCQGRDEADG